ncbi:MAG: T9SS type A sorting domain-containing protein [Bacteroidales bacterium]|nr:T9SS type A sorting domain-containing protein [Bacteroidales bacterium]
MKKIYLIVFSLILYLGGFAQNSFPTDSAMWKVTYLDQGYGDQYFDLYKLIGDTIISDTTYSKLYFSHFALLSDSLLDNIDPQSYLGGFRQENNKVWFKPKNWEYSNILIYDFNLNINEYIEYYVYFSENGEFFIPSHQYPRQLYIMSIEEGNNTLIYNTGGGCGSMWYYGMGSNLGPLAPLYYYAIGNPCNRVLSCFKHNDTVKYLNSFCNQCFCPFVNIDKVITEEINIYPNPTEDILNIKVSENEKNKTISIRSIDGKLIEIHQEALTQLNISNLRAGVFIVEVETDRGNFNKLVIKK